MEVSQVKRSQMRWVDQFNLLTGKLVHEPSEAKEKDQELHPTTSTQLPATSTTQPDVLQDSQTTQIIGK